MLERLFEKVRPWVEALDGADDARGEFLLMLETRVSRLEDEVARLGGSHRSGASSASTPSSGAEAE
jgi:hypothetical protein